MVESLTGFSEQTLRGLIDKSIPKKKEAAAIIQQVIEKLVA